MIYLSVLSFVLLCTFTSMGGDIVLIRIDGSINPSTSDYVRKAINDAKNRNAECLIIELNTPGGLLKSTRYIVSDLLTSPIPVVVYVSPGGSRGVSAGVFITLSANIAAMAPGTNIGASHPVGGSGEKLDSVMNEKVTNDAAAFIRSISEKRKRNMKWAEDAVRLSVSITDKEALDSNVIDLIATDINDLVQKINGMEVETSEGKKVLNTSNSQIIHFQKSWFQNILDIISDPNIAYILMMIGIWGIILEFYNPGTILPGVVGIICLILGLYGLHTLPINYAGVTLIILGIILFILEIKITSYGMLTVAGIISVFIGSMMLIDPISPLETAIDISMNVIISTVVIIAFLFALLAWMVLKAHRRKAMTGESGIIGETAEVLTDIKSGEGRVKLMGEIWNAVSDEELKKGEKVIVQAIDGLTVKVKKSSFNK